MPKQENIYFLSTTRGFNLVSENKAKNNNYFDFSEEDVPKSK